MKRKNHVTSALFGGCRKENINCTERTHTLKRSYLEWHGPGDWDDHVQFQIPSRCSFHFHHVTGAAATWRHATTEPWRLCGKSCETTRPRNSKAFKAGVGNLGGSTRLRVRGFVGMKTKARKRDIRVSHLSMAQTLISC